MLRSVRRFFTLNNIILLAALLLAVSWMWGTMQALQKNYTLQQVVDHTRQEVELLELEVDTIEFQKRYFESDEYLELAVRERLNKVAKGEKVLILPANTVSDEIFEPTKQAEISRPSNFSQWVEFFFGEKRSGV